MDWFRPIILCIEPFSGISDMSLQPFDSLIRHGSIIAILIIVQFPNNIIHIYYTLKSIFNTNVRRRDLYNTE